MPLAKWSEQTPRIRKKNTKKSGKIGKLIDGLFLVNSYYVFICKKTIYHTKDTIRARDLQVNGAYAYAK